MRIIRTMKGQNFAEGLTPSVFVLIAKCFPLSKFIQSTNSKKERLLLKQFLEDYLKHQRGDGGWIEEFLVLSEDRMLMLDLLMDYLKENPEKGRRMGRYLMKKVSFFFFQFIVHILERNMQHQL